MEKVFLPVLLGTARKDRLSEHVARFVVAEMEKRNDLSTELFDVCDFDLPQDQYGQVIKDQFPEWRNAIVRADGLVLVAPEYNHSFPGTMKSVLDLLLKEYVHKAVGIVAVSSGPWGGTRMIESFLPVVRELGLAVTFRDLQFPRVGEAFDEEFNLKDDVYVERAEKFLDELVWMARTLRWGRENL